MAEPEQVVYEYDPVSNVRDETGYWRLLNRESKECALGITPAPSPTGISPLMLPLAVIGMMGIVMMTGDEKRGSHA